MYLFQKSVLQIYLKKKTGVFVTKFGKFLRYGLHNFGKYSKIHSCF